MTGHRHRTPRIDISWRSNDVGHPRLGIVVPRFGATAVARNRIRRRLREYTRRRVVPEFSDIDLVVRARPAIYSARMGDLVRDLTQWLESASL